MDAVARESVLRVHAFLPHSHANGPGARAVVWVQGCTLGCPGCFNPGTHAAEGGEALAVEALFDRIVGLRDSIEGVTVSGGEPLQQGPPLRHLLKRVRHGTALSVVLFTGYTWEEVQALPGAADLLACVDVLIAGRYERARHLGRGLRGSANQTVHLLTSRYSLVDIDVVPEVEVVISADGEVWVSGVGLELPC